MQKLEIHLTNEGSGLALFCTDLGHIFESNVGNVFGVLLRGKGPRKLMFAYHIVLLSLYFQAKNQGHYKYWAKHELIQF